MIDQAVHNNLYRPGWLARLFAPHCGYLYFNFSSDRLFISRGKSISSQIPFLSIGLGVAVERGLFWHSLAIHLDNGEIRRLGGINKKRCSQFQVQLNQAYRKHVTEVYRQLTPEIQQAHRQAQVMLSGRKYIRKDVAGHWFKEHVQLGEFFKRTDFQRYIKPDVAQFLPVVLPFLERGYGYVAQLNDDYVKRQLDEFNTFFDQVESNPLTDNQRKACVIDEQNNLVLAGAGTGKTSTMIGRAGYLIKSCLARPEQILMLAFARKAAEEMDERIKAKLNTEALTVKTFHSLGKLIIAQVEGIVPSINPMAEDSHLRARFVDEQLKRLLQNNDYKSRLITYFVRFAYPYKSAFQFKSLGEYNCYILENDIRTFQGELVKSFEECEIANFLYRQGISYRYESNYEVSTSGPDYRVYQPDFYLPDYGIYIEHFAVNEHNQTPSFIDQEKYLQGMEWKRTLHKEHSTCLIETYSYQKQQGVLTQSLERQLKEKGVEFRPLPNNQLLQELNQFGQVSLFAELLSQMLALFKSAYQNIKGMVMLAKQHEDHERMQAAAFLFEPIYEAYQQHLEETNTIDFDDMIGKAIEYVEDGSFHSPYTFILVDEFQDISASRARLIKALLSQHPDSSLFCVGDDWQSIYRFTGSDVTLTKEFEQHFGATVISVLDRTFRFNNKIGNVASRFVMQNSTQIGKQILSHDIIDHNAISLIKTNNDQVGLNAALNAIAKRAKTNSSVLILSRFQFRKPQLAEQKRRFPTLNIRSMTIHASKGKEADYVIVLGLEKGKNGFPSEKATHHLLELLLPPNEAFPFAEERRLFYVALTRARHHVYLVCDADNASDFIRELVEEKYEINCDEFIGDGFQEKIADISCPVCKTGFLVSRDGNNGSFFGCSQYPLCNYTESACPWCGGGLKEHGRFRVCENKRCDYAEPICPKCGGKLILRKGRYGQFWGCSHYRKDAEFSCGHTEKFIDLQGAKHVR